MGVGLGQDGREIQGEARGCRPNETNVTLSEHETGPKKSRY